MTSRGVSIAMFGVPRDGLNDSDELAMATRLPRKAPPADGGASHGKV
jgi:hypothetical protein